MYYDRDIWLEILSRADPYAICRFSRTCLWAKCLVEAHIRSLPRLLIHIHVAILPPLQFQCIIRDEDGKQFKQVDFSSDICSSIASSNNERCPVLHAALSSLKYTDVVEAKLNHLKVDSTTVERVLEATRSVNARCYTCQISLTNGCTLYVKGGSSQMLTNGLRILEASAAFMLDGTPSAELSAFLLEVFAPKDCLVLSYRTNCIMCDASTIVEFLKMSAGKQPASARISIDFVIVPQERPYTRFYRTIVDLMSTKNLLEFYDVNLYLEKKLDEKLEIKRRNCGSYFRLKRLFIDQVGDGDTYMLIKL